MVNSKSNNIPVLVLGLCSQGVDAIMSLQSYQIKCVGVDINPNNPGFYLRRIKPYLCPDPLKDELKWVNFLIQIHNDNFNKKAVLILATDLFAHYVYRNYNHIAEYYIINNSGYQPIDNLLNKWLLYKTCKNLDIETPKTSILEENEDIYSAAKQLEFPFIIKPQYAFHWRKTDADQIIKGQKVFLVNNQDDLNKQWNLLSSITNKLIAQEIIPGPDQNLFYYVFYRSHDGQINGYFGGQKLRIKPIHFGSGTFVKYAEVPEILDKCIFLLNALNYEGQIGIEFKLDQRDNCYKLIEVNPRFGLWDSFGKKAGIDFFKMAYDDLTGINVNPQIPKAHNYYWLAPYLDLKVLIDYQKDKTFSLWNGFKTYFNKLQVSELYFSEPRMLYYLFIKKPIRRFFRILIKSVAGRNL
jgi:D-aspartate ligase